MNIVDAVIILIVLCGAVVGFKRGVIKELVMTVGFLLVFIVSFYLKNPIAEWLSPYLPFFDFWGIFEGVTVLNIILYQILAFLVVFSIVMVIFRILLEISGFIETILKFTIILGIPSKILGAIVGAIEGFVIAFMVVFVLNQPMLDIGIMNDSKYKDKVLNTPVLTNIVSSVNETVRDVYELMKDEECKKDHNVFNRRAIDVMLEHKMITVGYVEKLIDNGKIAVPGIDSVLNNYR